MLLTKSKRTSGFVPGYQRIEAALRQRIHSGDWPSGVLLPSRRTLAREFQVDVNTLQRAITPLLDDGTLRADGSRGTFVAGGSAAVVRLAAPPARTDLSAARTATIGIIATVDPDSVWMKAIVHGTESLLSQEGSASRFFDIRRAGRAEGQVRAALREAAATLLEDGVDGLIVVGIFDTPGLTEGVASLLSLTQLPIVYISWRDTQRPLHHVFYDSRFAGYQAAQSLIHCGYKRFGFVAPFHADWVEERITSARMALTDAGLPASALKVYAPGDGPYATAPIDEQLPLGYEAVTSATNRGLEIDDTGLIAANDKVAHGVIAWAKDNQFTLGKRFGLVGFDDDPESRALGLTTVRPPLEALGAEGGRLILRAVAGEKTIMQIRLPSRVIARASTCA